MKKLLQLIPLALFLMSCGVTPPTVVVGPAGAKGDVGDRGLPGADGNPGTSCTVSSVPANGAAPTGGALIACPDGTQSLVLNGTPGVNGTVITPVPLCPGVTTYPSVFIEVAFCIQSRLYAVYSANSGFLTEIVPGAYTSSAIGSRCDLTVSANCAVSN